MENKKNKNILNTGSLTLQILGTKTFKICPQVGGKWEDMVPRVSHV